MFSPRDSLRRSETSSLPPATLSIGTTTLGPEAAKIVAELSTADKAEAFFSAWQALLSRDGAVWHRGPHSAVAQLSATLEYAAPKLADQKSYAMVSDASAALDKARGVVNGSSIRDSISTEEKVLLIRELVDMYTMVSTMTGSSKIVLDLRVERERGFIEHYHVDYGTAVLLPLVGPGTHFVSRDNIPPDYDGKFFRNDLPDPKQVFEVPTGSMLFMRGKSDTLSCDRQGLWHASPPKTWNGRQQWSERVVLIATTPEAEIKKPNQSIAQSLFPSDLRMSA